MPVSLLSAYGDIGDSLTDSLIGDLFFPYSSLEPKCTKVFTFNSIESFIKEQSDSKWSLKISLPPLKKFLWSIYPEQFIT